MSGTATGSQTTGRGRGVRTSGTSTALGRLVPSPDVSVVVGAVGAIGMVVSASAIGSIPQPASDTWWYTVPVGTGPGAHVAFYAALVLLLAGWAGLGHTAYRGLLSVRRCWLVLAVWGLPFFLGPPLFSRDLYSYLAQGRLAASGLNPYVVAPSALGPGNLLTSIASVWRHTASPYGPLFVSVSHAGTSLSGSSIVSGILVFRALELVGVVLMLVSLPVLARRLGNDPGIALWLAVLSPLALFSFVSSGHNDALMMGLMLAGLTLGTGGWLRWGIALCALAATVKLPAAAGAVFLVADRCTQVPPARRWAVIAEGVAITVLVVAGVTVGAGLGWTWLGPTALHVPTELRVLITPLVSVATFLHGVLHAIGLPVSLSATVSVVQALGAVAAVAGILWMVFHTRDHDAVRLCGLALVLFVVLSPTLWPWYLMWGVAVLAATSAQRSRALAAVAGLAMLLVGPGGTPMLDGGAYWVTGPLLLAVGVWVVVSGRVTLAEPAHAV